jgi:hypothetical protein
MSHKPILYALSALALVTLACGVSINLPVKEVNTGPTVTEDINIPLPGTSGPARLTLSFGAGELILAPGAADALASGEAVYNVNDLKPEIKVSGSSTTIQTGDLEFSGIPNFDKDFVNRWDLKLGDVPMDLTIQSGAYEGKLELGGLSLTDLTITDGAASVDLRFSEPNLVEMDTLRYETGASSVKISGLANANFENMIFKSGAGDYTLDFSGELLRDATVTVDSGLSSMKIIVPEGISARVLVDTGLSNVDVSGAWEISGDTYTLDGSGPRLTINVNIGAGNLDLSTR